MAVTNIPIKELEKRLSKWVKLEIAELKRWLEEVRE